MSNAEDVITPYGATHVQWFYGDPQYFRKTTRPHLNQVREEWQDLAVWHEWDFRACIWIPVGEGFSSRRLKELNRTAPDAASLN